MKCPKCKSAADVIDSRQRGGGTMRKLKCRSCRNKFNTIEMVIVPESTGYVSINAKRADRFIEHKKEIITELSVLQRVLSTLTEKLKGTDI